MNADIRLAYSTAAKNENATKQLEKLVKQHSQQDNPTIVAYKGVIEALKAKFFWLPFQKMMYLNSSKSLLSKAVKEEPENIEIRFLRFSIQISLPAMLMQSFDIQEDKEVILQHIEDSNIADDFKAAIADFLVQSGKCTQKEIETLTNKFPVK